jgi:hypothetical protein
MDILTQASMRIRADAHKECTVDSSNIATILSNDRARAATNKL